MQKDPDQLPSPFASNSQPLLNRERVIIFLDDKQWALPSGLRICTLRSSVS
jgi:hypothetical protein